jgi:hypothetical protein
MGVDANGMCCTNGEYLHVIPVAVPERHTPFEILRYDVVEVDV